MKTEREEFDRLVETHSVVPVVTTVFADEETPVSIYRKIGGGPGSFLLESAHQGVWNRYSFIGGEVYGRLIATGERVEWVDNGLDQARAFGPETPSDGLAALELLAARWHTPRIPHLPRLASGLVGHIGWDAVRLVESLPNPPDREHRLPDIAFGFVRDLVVLDHATGNAHLVTVVLADGAEPAEQLWKAAQQRLGGLTARLATPSESSVTEVDMDAVPDATARTSDEAFTATVERSRKHIVDGDIFQVVPSIRFDMETNAGPLDVYRVLRLLNPSPYMYLIAAATESGVPYEVVGASPEALVTVSHGTATMHPIAGSRPRGEDSEEDAALASELLADPKERSEHIMLVDLARNDLSKVAIAGSVRVSDFMTVERFRHIMHIVSTVVCELREDATAVDALRATFPAGTLSGAPKPRALEIIDTLEPSSRGIYGGVVGYFDFQGDADVAIAIRTVTMSDGKASVQSGAGLVADSVAETEIAEIKNKARSPLTALAIAESMQRMGMS
ncbi:chorismate-binding protein [uncultured Agrococcus sp.]|uniref:chorismate-binding protein n=1 Tax=uncultured Agrococcus sp. TaxID=382258 RepID=UPI0025FBA630|nr:chorismate-binding protein [uncultured Agrococcus sp.]